MRFLKILKVWLADEQEFGPRHQATGRKKKMSRWPMLRAALVLASIHAQTPPPASGPEEGGKVEHAVI